MRNTVTATAAKPAAPFDLYHDAADPVYVKFMHNWLKAWDIVIEKRGGKIYPDPAMKSE
jgi:hypothetical protein